MFIVNRTAKEEAIRQIRNKTRFLSRFPIGRDFIDPALIGLEPTDHNINIAGNLPYHCYPHTHHFAGYNGYGLYPAWDRKFTPMIDKCDLTSYQPEVIFTPDRSVIEVIFPAEKQIYTGDYDVIVVAKLYSEGYSKSNTITITSDYTNAFTLIPHNETPDTDDSDVVIDYTVVNPDKEISDDDYVNNMSYDKDTNVLTLQRLNGAVMTETIPTTLNWYE